jgi:hypothetical protein
MGWGGGVIALMAVVVALVLGFSLGAAHERAALHRELNR